MLRIAAGLSLLGLLLACTTPPTPTPASPAATPRPAAKAAVIETAPSGAEKTASSPAPKRAAAPPPEWDQLVAAAKQEGKVALIGDRGTDLDIALTESFQRRYGIPVEYLASTGREIPPRLSAEREAGQFLWDVVVTGTTTGLESLIPMGALDPVEPALLLPEVRDPNSWRGGAPEFADTRRRILVMTPFQRGTLFVNTNLVDPEKLTSYRDLLQPEWRGKLAADDPRTPGPGQATFTFFYMHPALGPDFIAALARQDVTMLRDFQREVDWVGQGNSHILIGTADRVVEERMKQGVPVAIVDPRRLREGSDVSPANGAVSLINRSPHPNAAKVYLNWLLSKEGQADFIRATGYVSARTDVPTDHALPWRIPQPGSVKTYNEEAMAAKEPLLSLLREVFGQ